MPFPMVCRKKAKILTFLLFLVGLTLASYTNNWWPGMLLVVGIPLAIKQHLLGNRYDMSVTLFVFLGGFISISWDIECQIFLPVLFTIVGIYILYRDLTEHSLPQEDEEESDLNEEIEEEQHKK